MKTSHQLRLKDLELRVHLGCSREEQALPQQVKVEVGLRFRQPPTACESDRIEDTICYEKISSRLTEVAASKTFHLIEHLAQSLYLSLKEELSEENFRIRIRLHKLHLPMRYHTDGAWYQIEEEGF